MTPTPIPPGAQAPIAASFGALSGPAILLYLLVGLAVVVLLTPLILRRGDGDFFKVPYITWYLVHYGIASLAIIAIVILGVAGIISGEVISALFGSLLGYTLGSSAARQNEPSRPVLIVTSPSLSNGITGTAYTQTLSASGGTAPYTWSIHEGSLPTGLILQSNGTIVGTPSAPGTTKFTVVVTDGAHGTATKDFTITIS